MFQLADTEETKSYGMDYHIELVTKDDKLRILKFLRRFFFRDEPLNYSIQLVPESEDSTCLELEEYCSSSSLENNLSLMAVSTSGAIVGVMLNGKELGNISYPWHCPIFMKYSTSKAELCSLTVH